jgi:raffinose/stachyose/melibiose transport system permease protein
MKDSRFTTGNPFGYKLASFSKYMLLILFSLTTVYPLFWVLLTSFKDDNEIFGNAFGLPRIWKFSNYLYTWTSMNLTNYFINSIVYTICAVAVILTISGMAAFVLARVLPNRIIYLYYTIGIMIPFQGITIPFVRMYHVFGLNDTKLGVIIAYIVVNISFSVFVLVAFMKTLPQELEDAATIDGCGRTRTFLSIILPISKAGLATIGIIAAVNSWNDFYVTLMVTSTESNRTMNLACYLLRATGERTAHYGLMSAGSVMLVLPIIIVYLLFQKQVVKGLVAGAVKG